MEVDWEVFPETAVGMISYLDGVSKKVSCKLNVNKSFTVYSSVLKMNPVVNNVIKYTHPLLRSYLSFKFFIYIYLFYEL